MKQILLATALIALPVAVFSGVEHYLVPAAAPAAAAAPSLGDLSGFAAIVTDTQDIAGNGDLAAAQTRITDLETAWDEAEPALRPQAPLAWGNADDAIDAALSALRAGHPDAAKVTATLAALQSVLADPSGGTAASGPVVQVAGIDVTDAGGHPLPCEMMLSDLRDAVSGGKVPQEAAAKVSDLQSRATERCNADDDRRADAFSAEALAMVTK